MKTPQTSQQTRHRSRAWFLGLLLASAAPAASLLADGPESTETRKRPLRLPTVTVAAKTSEVRQNLFAAKHKLPAQETSAPSADPTSTISDELPTRWLRSTTASASSEVARRLISQASAEYSVGAWLSAETSAWEALRWACEAVDLEARENWSASTPGAINATERFQTARHAIREARDFSGRYGVLNADGIARMAKSHVTDLLDMQRAEPLTPTDASDRYLDEARVLLAPIAARNIEAAQTMDLLAAIYLSRADASTLPSATSLCLRRAALQGQPQNAGLATRLGMHLADVGLYEEARWALEHSLSLEADQQAADALVKVLRRTGQRDEAARLIATMQNHAQEGVLAQREASRPKIPQVTQLSPAEFAALSKSMVPESRQSNLNATLASTTQRATNVAREQDATIKATSSALTAEKNDKDEPGVIRRFLGSFKRIW